MTTTNYANTRPATKAELTRAAWGEPQPCECPEPACDCRARFFHFAAGPICADCRAGAHWIAPWVVA